MNAIANVMGQGEPDFASLTSGITNLHYRFSKIYNP